MTNESYAAACNKLFESPQWDEAQLEIMITAGRLLRSEVLEHHPGLDLGFLADRLDIPTPSEKREQAQQVVASPPPLEPIVEETGQQATEDQGREVIAEERHPPEAAPGSDEAREVEVAKEPTAGTGEVSAGGAGNEGVIFGDYGPIEKL